MYTQRQSVQLPAWQDWARHAKEQLDQMMRADTEAEAEQAYVSKENEQAYADAA